MYHRAVPSFTTRKRRKFLQRFIMRLWAERLASNPPEENDERSSEQAAGYQENFGDDQGHSHCDVVYGYTQRNHRQHRNANVLDHLRNFLDSLRPAQSFAHRFPQVGWMRAARPRAA